MYVCGTDSRLTTTHSDETVEVGTALFEIDTEGVATTTSGSTAAADNATLVETVTPPANEPAVAAAATTALPKSTSKRVPSIRFLGKEGWARLLSGNGNNSDSNTASPTLLENLGPMYGRPSFSEEEMEALILGGASLAPHVTYHSSGAKFI